MKASFSTKLLCLFTVLSVSFSCISCGKEPAENTAPTTEPVTHEIIQKETAQPLADGEILPLTESWTGRFDEGILEEANSCHLTVINKAEDLTPFRQYLPDLTAEEEARILADKEGKCVLLEVTSPDEYTLSSVNTIDRMEGTIEIFVTEETAEEPQPTHSFFLFYFSSEVYRGESIQPLFFY